MAIESVLAGTPGFVTALAPAVKSRAGAEPRLATDPRQAFSYCAESGGLLVLEYAGPEWLPLVRDLRSLCGDAISVVVAVDQGRLGEVSGLQRAGADEVVAWDGRADPVAWAVERILASRGRGAVQEPPAAATPVRGFSAPAPTPPPTLRRAAPGAPAAPAAAASPAPVPQWPAAAAPAAEPGPLPSPVPRAEPPAAAPAPTAVPSPSPVPAPVPAAPVSFTIREVSPLPGAAAAAVAWPAGVVAGPEAERLLSAVVTGAASEPGPARAVAVQTAQGLSDLERRALADVAVPVDAALFRRASALRLRVAVALGSAPPPGTAIDSAAVQSLLAELDSALSELKAAQETSETEHHPGIGVLRTALVKEAIDLTDAVHRISPAQAPAIQAPAAPATRLLSNRAVLEAPAEERRLGRGWLALLVLVALAAAGFHGYNYLTRRPPAPPPSIGGSPSGSVGVRQGSVSIVVPEAGKAPDPRQLESFKGLEEAKGNAVREVAPGVWVSVPAAAGEGGKKP